MALVNLTFEQRMWIRKSAMGKRRMCSIHQDHQLPGLFAPVYSL